MTESLPEFQMEIASPYTFESTLNRLGQGIQSEGFLLLHEIDTQKIVGAHGVEIDGLRQLLFFHPRYIDAILKLNRAGVIEAPLKLVVLETSEGVHVRYTQPTYLFGRYAGLQSIGEELQAIVMRITEAIVNS